MFYDANAFNNGGNPMTEWNNSWDNTKDFGYMFYHAQNFNADISGWNTSNIVDMTRMFSETDSFDQDLSGWDFSNVQLFTYQHPTNLRYYSLLTNARAFSDENYGKLLVRLADQYENEQLNGRVRFEANLCTPVGEAAAAAKTLLETENQWQIFDELTPQPA